MTIIQDANRTRASRAHGARSERSGEPCTVPRRAHAPGRDGRRAVRPDDMLRGRIQTCRFRQIRRTKAAARAPHRTSTLRGVNDPHRPWPGPHGPRGTGVVHAPRSIRHQGALTGGRQTAPSARDDLEAHNLLSRIGFRPRCRREVRAHDGRQRAWRFECWGTSSIPALVPRLAGFPSQPGTETAASIARSG